MFVDRSVGKRYVPEALTQAGAVVHVHDAYFAPMTPDEVWLAHAGQRGWVVLTKDDNIRRHRLALTAIMRHRVRAFVLPPGNLPGEEMARIVVRALARIRQMVRDYAPPLIAVITRPFLPTGWRQVTERNPA